MTVTVIPPGEAFSRPGGNEALVPFADLRQLVFAYFRARKITRLEQCSDDELEALL